MCTPCRASIARGGRIKYNAETRTVESCDEREREREKVLGAPIYSAETEENARSHRECEAACHHESLSRL